MLALIEGISLTDAILILGLVGVVVTRVGEGRGWFKSAAGLRTENTDLLRRNQELEDTVGRHSDTIRVQGEQIIRLEEQVRALEKLDQSAVLQALQDHEAGAIQRAETTHGYLERISTALETPTSIITTTTKTGGTP